MAGLPRRIRFRIGRWPNRSGITTETILEPSGRAQGPTTTDRRMANPRWKARRRRQAISIRPIPMMFPGIGPIAFRPLSHLPINPMCRAAPPRPSRFLGVTAPRKPSISPAAIKSLSLRSNRNSEAQALQGGQSVRRSSKSEGGSVPTIQDETADRWWARRRCAFCPPYGAGHVAPSPATLIFLS